MLEEDVEMGFNKDIYDIINDWCLDDKGKHVLYKEGTKVDRYYDFQLYKMIARTVHRHTPEAQLERPLFKKFIVPSGAKNMKKIKDKLSFTCINLDTMPVLY